MKTIEPITESKIGTEDEFINKFSPINQSLDPTEITYMIDWNTPAFEAIANSNKKLIWTVVDSDSVPEEIDGEPTSGMIIIAGYHLVNRQGYILTEVPWITGNEEFIY